MKIFSHVASRRNRHTIVAVFGVKKEIPDVMKSVTKNIVKETAYEPKSITAPSGVHRPATLRVGWCMLRGRF
jgi:hypothetical protein